MFMGGLNVKDISDLCAMKGEHVFSYITFNVSNINKGSMLIQCYMSFLLSQYLHFAQQKQNIDPVLTSRENSAFSKTCTQH